MMQNEMSQLVNTIQVNLEQVRSRIEHAAKLAGRASQEVHLVVVTKTHPVQVIEALVEAGVHSFGESYVEEGIPKIAALAGRSSIEWHMIGHVQSRKARQVCENYQILHSLDSLKLANHLDRFAGEFGVTLPVLLECNVSGEESKFGWAAWDEARWPDLLPPITQVLALPNLEVRGLMTIAPFSNDPEQARPYFSRLRKMKNFLSSELTKSRLAELSMGMSADFETAIEEGATIVRIGQAILGPRPNT